MKITLGEWKTRDGRKAEVVHVCDERQRAIGWIGIGSVSWIIDGGMVDDTYKTQWDLVSPWTDPVPWDWSTTPPWVNWIAQDSDGFWILFDGEPELLESRWSSGPGMCSCTIPLKYSPKWSGDWKLSKIQRPKEVAK